MAVAKHCHLRNTYPEDTVSAPRLPRCNKPLLDTQAPADALMLSSRPPPRTTPSPLLHKTNPPSTPPSAPVALPPHNTCLARTTCTPTCRPAPSRCCTSRSDTAPATCCCPRNSIPPGISPASPFLCARTCTSQGMAGSMASPQSVPHSPSRTAQGMQTPPRRSAPQGIPPCHSDPILKASPDRRILLHTSCTMIGRSRPGTPPRRTAQAPRYCPRTSAQSCKDCQSLVDRMFQWDKNSLRGMAPAL